MNMGKETEFIHNFHSEWRLLSCLQNTKDHDIQNSSLHLFCIGICLREDHKLQVFENKVLRKISEPKKDEICEQLEVLHNELRDLYESLSYIHMAGPQCKWNIISRPERNCCVMVALTNWA